jgi:hypothetical protein
VIKQYVESKVFDKGDLFSALFLTNLWKSILLAFDRMIKEQRCQFQSQVELLKQEHQKNIERKMAFITKYRTEKESEILMKNQ